MNDDERIDLGGLVGGRRDRVLARLKEQGIEVSAVREEDMPAPLVLLFSLRPVPRVSRGQSVRVVVSGDRAIGFSADREARLVRLERRIESLEAKRRPASSRTKRSGR
jgi:hypothetical protein